MKTLRQTIYYPSRANTFRLYYLTDLHVGAKACDENLLRRDIAAIESDPRAYWIGGGDYIDAIARKGDKRYRESELASWLAGKDDVMGQQRDYLVDMLAPIAHKCLGLIDGNHEDAAIRYYDRNIYGEIVTKIADIAGRPPPSLALGTQGFVIINWRRGTPDDWGGTWSMVVYCHHGYGGGRLPGAHALALGRILGDYECDLAMTGHRHIEQVLSKARVCPSGYGAKKKISYAAFVASYLDTFIKPSSDTMPLDTYPERKGLPASKLGTFPIVIKPSDRRISLHVNGCLLAFPAAQEAKVA